MAFRAELSLGGKTFDVLNCSFKLSRDVDTKGRPASNIYGGIINIQIESTESSLILETMTSQFKPISGSIIFKKGDEEAKMKELVWENGYIISYEEDIDVVGSKPMSINFSVSAQVLKVGDAQFEQNWPQ